MISKSPEDRQFYEARMKFLHDAEARLIAAREEGMQAGIEKGREEGRQEGREEGREEGRREGIVGMIRTLQGLLGEEPADLNDLLLRSSPELEQLADELRRRVRQRGG
jgi:flagellar biosynthesis/type III secretory pathway protein FliH